jgi:CheY-like chemotaxis protein
MNPPRSGFDGRFIVVADEDRAVAGFVIETLLGDGHAVFQAYDGLSAVELALGLKVCDLVISNTRVGGVAGLELIHELRASLPKLPILYLTNQGPFLVRAGATATQRRTHPPRAVHRRGAAGGSRLLVDGQSRISAGSAEGASPPRRRLTRRATSG